jgi:hypothetical protein
MLMSVVTVGFMSWIIYVILNVLRDFSSLSVVASAPSTTDRKISRIFLSLGCLLSFGFCWIQRYGIFYYFYFAFPVYFISMILQVRKKKNWVK